MVWAESTLIARKPKLAKAVRSFIGLLFTPNLVQIPGRENSLQARAQPSFGLLVCSFVGLLGNAMRFPLNPFTLEPFYFLKTPESSPTWAGFGPYRSAKAAFGSAWGR